MTEITRPDTDQIKFRSARTGEQVLDAYLEAAEVGDRPLGDLMGELFDGATGKVKSGLVQFRLNGATRELEARSGTYANPDDGWLGTTAFFSRFMGEWATATQYRASDYVTITGITYLVTADHISGAAPDMTKLLDIIGNPTLSAIGAAAGAAADKLPYMTGASSAAFADFTAFGRSLVAAASASAARTALGLSAVATAALSSFPSFTMGTGTVLTLAADPVLAMEAATMQWVNARVATKADPIGYTPVNRNGDTLTGFLTAHANPTAALHMATKGYVDNTLVAQVGDKVSKLGDTMSGALTVNAAIVGNSISVGANGVWHAGNLTPSNYAPLSGASFSGSVLSTKIDGDMFRTMGDFGGAFVNWNTRPAALAVDVANNASAYSVLRVTHQGERSLVGIDAYAGGSAASAPQLQFHFDGATSAHIFTGASHLIGGNAVWHAGNDSTFLKKRGDLVAADRDGFGTGFTSVNMGGYSDALLSLVTGGSTGQLQLQASYQGTFQWRNKTDSATWSAWRTIPFTESNGGFAGYVSGSRVFAGYDDGTPGSVSASAWFRSLGATGWYSATYSVGIYSKQAGVLESYGATNFRMQYDSASVGPIIILKNRSATAAGHTYGGILFDAYRDVSDPSYVGGITCDGSSAAGNTASLYFRLVTNGTASIPPSVAVLDASGNFTANGNITAYSDERIKTAFAPSYLTLDEMLTVEHLSYDRIDTGARQVGVKAQQLAKVLPLAVLHNAEADRYSVDYGRAGLAFAASLVREVQALRARVAALELAA